MQRRPFESRGWGTFTLAVCGAVVPLFHSVATGVARSRPPASPPEQRAALREAIVRHDPGDVQRLLDRGAPVRAGEGFPSALACVLDQPNDGGQVLATLLRRREPGAEPVDVNETIDGVPALLLALQTGHISQARMLVDRGADADRAIEGELPPLHWAVVHDRPDIVQAMLRRGVDRNRYCPGAPLVAGRKAYRFEGTPLYLAQRIGRAEIVRLLTQAGARSRGSIRRSP